MPMPLDDVCCARVPVVGLAALGPLRCAPHIEIVADGTHSWVRWDHAHAGVLRLLLPMLGVELYLYRNQCWYRPGQRLPCPGPPVNAPVQRLDQVLFPERIEPLPTATHVLEPCRLGLAVDDRLRPTTALRGALAALAHWAESATSAQLEALRGARHGERVLLVGKRLPPLPVCERFWGRRVLVPLGRRPEPSLPESALVRLLGLAEGEAALLEGSGVEVFQSDALEPLTRSGIRRAAGEGAA